MAPVNIKVAANDFLDFVNASPTPFHAVKSVKERLSKVGFTEIKVSSNLLSRKLLAEADSSDRRKNPGRLP
jgi:aspartyl aminopeptidase